MAEEAAASARKRKRQLDPKTWTSLCDSVAARMQKMQDHQAAAAAAREPEYKYVPIADALKGPDSRVCLFAVVLEIGAAVRSNGTDYTVTLRIVDPSRPTGTSVTFFAEEAVLLPRVKSSGDVISLHEVEINRHRDDYFVKFNKKCSSFALFQSKLSADCNPYQTSKKYYASKDDKEHLTRMRTCFPLGLKDLELQLRSLKSDSTFDLVCKVLHVCEDDGKWIFYVWDGTDTPAAEFQAIWDPEAVKSILLHQGPALPREVLCKMPRVGTVLRIFSDKSVKAASQMREGICWARFWNITCKQESGIWKGILSESSGVRLLSNEDGGVVDRMKMFDSRNANQVHRQPMASSPSNVTDLNEAHDDLIRVLVYMYCIDEALHKVVMPFCCHVLPTKALPHDNLLSVLSTVEYEKEAYATLMDSLTHREVTDKLKSLVRVVAVYPCRPSQLRLLSICTYALKLTLEDHTARINAYVHKDEVAAFFGGFLTEDSIMKKINKLLGVLEPEDGEEVAPLARRNPPWIWCGLMSYYLKENDVWGSRRYQIKGTTISD